MPIFGDNLRVAREKSGLTRRQLAAQLSISEQAYGKYEAGSREPKLDTLIALSNILHISIDSLLGVAVKVDDYARSVEYCRGLGCNVDDSSKPGRVIVTCGNPLIPGAKSQLNVQKQTFTDTIADFRKGADEAETKRRAETLHWQIATLSTFKANLDREKADFLDEPKK